MLALLPVKINWIVVFPLSQSLKCKYKVYFNDLGTEALASLLTVPSSPCNNAKIFRRDINLTIKIHEGEINKYNFYTETQ